MFKFIAFILSSEGRNLCPEKFMLLCVPLYHFRDVDDRVNQLHQNWLIFLDFGLVVFRVCEIVHRCCSMESAAPVWYWWALVTMLYRLPVGLVNILSSLKPVAWYVWRILAQAYLVIEHIIFLPSRRWDGQLPVWFASYSIWRLFR